MSSEDTTLQGSKEDNSSTGAGLAELLERMTMPREPPQVVDVDECALCGAVGSKPVARLHMCGGCQAVRYCSRECQRADWARHKSGCYTLTPSDELPTPRRRTRITRESSIGQALTDPTRARFFATGEYRAVSPEDGAPSGVVLATLNVFSCIAVLACSPGCRAFGAHIYNGALLNSCRVAARRANVRSLALARSPPQLLPELIAGLRKTFRGKVSETEVTVHLIGGHRAMDEDMALRTGYFAGAHDARLWNFSWHVENAVRRALPQARVKREHLLRFGGVPGEQMTPAEERRLSEEGQRYQVVALDVDEMRLHTQTHFEEAVDRVALGGQGAVGAAPLRALEHDAAAMSSLCLMGAPLTEGTLDLNADY